MGMHGGGPLKVPLGIQVSLTRFGILGFWSYEIGILGYGAPEIGIFGIPGPPPYTPLLLALGLGLTLGVDH